MKIIKLTSIDEPPRELIKILGIIDKNRSMQHF